MKIVTPGKPKSYTRTWKYSPKERQIAKQIWQITSKINNIVKQHQFIEMRLNFLQHEKLNLIEQIKDKYAGDII
jgi:hypothetical protein